jgi:glycerophosphoryl diester phosphodiesterase
MPGRVRGPGGFLLRYQINMRRPWIVAHRGASGYAPENTLAAFRRAVELGAKFIETDLHLTRDLRFAAIHDSTLERTTNGRGLVHDFSQLELREFDAGSWFGSQFAGERLPTLDEILAFGRESDVTFYLEIKSEEAWGLHDALVGALRANKATDRVIVLSFGADNLERIHQLDDTVMTGFLFDEPRANAVDLALRMGARQLAPRADLVTAALVEQAHRADLRVVTWTLNEPGQMRAALAAGVDGVMTDYPDRLRAVIDEWFRSPVQGAE